MKQSDVIIGESYVFKHTTTEHKKDMIGTIVTVVGKRKGKKTPSKQNGIITGYGNRPTRFKLSNGRFANAGELRLINPL